MRKKDVERLEYQAVIIYHLLQLAQIALKWAEDCQEQKNCKAEKLRVKRATCLLFIIFGVFRLRGESKLPTSL
jgi:hypothetical protein